MGNNGGDLVTAAAAAERGRSRTRRVTVSKAKVTRSDPTNSGSKAEPNVINVMLQELNELTSGSETVNDSAVISEQRAGAVDGTGAAAAVTRSVQGVRAADTSAQTLGEAFNILTTHDTRLNSINAKLDELLVFVRELVTNKSGAQGNESQISVGGSGGATLRGRGSGHQQQQQPQQTEGGGGGQGTQQQPRAAFETPDRRGHQADQQQQQQQQPQQQQPQQQQQQQ